MTEKTQSTETEKKAKEREDMRKLQLGFLNSESVRNLFIANAGRNVAQYGKAGEATQENYLSGLTQADEHTGRLLAMPLLQGAQEALQAGKNLYEEGGSLTPLALLKNASNAYQGGITKIKVSDVLDMLGIEKVDESHVSKEHQDMYMEDFAKINEKMYNTLAGTYFNTISDQGVGKAIMQQSAQNVQGLEKILQTAKPKEESK